MHESGVIHTDKETMLKSYENMEQFEKPAWIKQEPCYEEEIDLEVNVQKPDMEVGQEKDHKRHPVKVEVEDDNDAVEEEFVSTFAMHDCPLEGSYFYCEECKLNYEGACHKHGPLIYVDNPEAQFGKTCTKDLSTVVQLSDKDRTVTERGGGEQPKLIGEDKEKFSICQSTHHRLCFPRREYLQKHRKLVHQDTSSKHEKSSQFTNVSSEDISTTLLTVGINSVTEVSRPEKMLSKRTENDIPVECVVHKGKTLNVCDEYEVTLQNEKANKMSNGKVSINDESVEDCELKVGSRTQMQNSENVEGQNSLNSCSICDKGYALCRHSKPRKRKFVGEKPYKCDVCGMGFSQCCNLKLHKRTHTGEKPCKCDVCGVGFSVQHSLKIHKRIHSGEKPYKCDVCGLCFSDSRNLKTHGRIHTGEKPYKCDVCGAAFSQCGHLKSHRRIHTGEKPYECDICGMTFAEVRRMRRHKRTHTGERPYKCDVCEVAFTDSWCLKRHRRVHTGEKPYECDVCSAVFAVENSLKTHKRMHTGERPYKCDLCNSGFTSKSSLKTHTITHTGETPYRCDVCGIGFSRCGHLKTHKRTHTGERPFKCDVCELKFTQKGHLQTHKRIHTGEKPYKCVVCGAEFTQCSHLETHKRIHTGEKPYACDVCGTAYSDSSSLRRHEKLRGHTEKKAYECNFYDAVEVDLYSKMHSESMISDGHVFSLSSYQKSYQQMHTREESYKWDVFGTAVAENNDLAFYEKIQAGDTASGWDLISAGLTQTGSLNSHKMASAEKKYYNWDIYRRTIAQSSDLESSHKICAGLID